MNHLRSIKGTCLSFLLLIIAGCAGPPTKEIPLITHSADGSGIRYGVSGQGDITLVFVHCWTCNHTFWSKQVDYFSPHYKVVWIDLAGHGGSGSKRTHYTMQAFGQDIAAVVNAVGATRVVLVGHSMGGPVAVEAAELLGDKVIGIVGVDTFYTDFEYPRDEEKIAAFVKPFEEDFGGTSQQLVRSMFTPNADPQTVDWVVEQFSSSQREMGISAMYEIFRWNAEKAPAILQRHATILRNINGAPTGSEKAHDPSVILIPDVGHFVAQVKPGAFNQALEHIIVDDLSKH